MNGTTLMMAAGGLVVVLIVVVLWRRGYLGTSSAAAPVPVSSGLVTEDQLLTAGVAFHNLTVAAANQKIARQMTLEKVDHNVAVFTGPYTASPTPAAQAAPVSPASSSVK